MEKTVLITGGEQGLGEALSQLFLDNNYKVISLDIKQGKLVKNKKFIKTNISNEKQVIDAFKKIKKIDVLINNAGIMRRSPTFESSASDFDALFSVNVKGTWLITKYALPKLNNDSKILMISSRHSSLPRNPGLYGLSKLNAQLIADLLEKEPLVEEKNIKVKTAILGPFRTKLSETGYTKEEYAKRKNLLDKEIVANKIFNLLMSDKKKLIYKEK